MPIQEHRHLLPSVEGFIAGLRDLHENEPDEAARWSKAADLLKELLADPELKAHAEGWPTSPAKLGLEGKHANLLFYEDPDYGFVINGLIKKPAAKTTVHDHGLSWTLYGVLDGAESVLRFRRTDGGKPGDLPSRAEVEATETIRVGKGHVDCIGTVGDSRRIQRRPGADDCRDRAQPEERHLRAEHLLSERRLGGAVPRPPADSVSPGLSAACRKTYSRFRARSGRSASSRCKARCTRPRPSSRAQPARSCGPLTRQATRAFTTGTAISWSCPITASWCARPA